MSAAFPWVTGCPAASKVPLLLLLCLLNWAFKTTAFRKKSLCWKQSSGKGQWRNACILISKLVKPPKKLPINSQEILIKVGVLTRPSCKKFKWREGEGKRFLSKQVRRARENKSNQQSLRWLTWQSGAWRKEEAVGQRAAGVYSSQEVSRVCDFNHKLLKNTVRSFSFISSPSQAGKSLPESRGMQVQGGGAGQSRRRRTGRREFHCPLNSQEWEKTAPGSGLSPWIGGGWWVTSLGLRGCPVV